MVDPNRAVLAATQDLRKSPGYANLRPAERAALDRDLARIEAALTGSYGATELGRTDIDPFDPFSVPLETPADLRGPGSVGGPAPRPVQQARPAPPARAPAGTEVIGERARRVLEAVDFSAFVAELIQGTFQAIVDATAQQVREYAKLVADLSKSVDQFTRDNVSPNQARDYLAERHGRDLLLVLPNPGEPGQPRLVPRDEDSSPTWLADYGLAGTDLSPELVEGPLLEAGRRRMGEERMQNLATLVLMGINRIVVDDGQLRARLQFHARAKEKASAELVAQTGGQQAGIAGRSGGLRTGVSTMVSTVDVNAQSEVSIKADLVGEVFVKFRTETFDLNRFADSQAIALINRHALTRNPNTSAAGGGGEQPSSPPSKPSSGGPS